MRRPSVQWPHSADLLFLVRCFIAGLLRAGFALAGCASLSLHPDCIQSGKSDDIHQLWRFMRHSVQDLLTPVRQALEDVPENETVVISRAVCHGTLYTVGLTTSDGPSAASMQCAHTCCRNSMPGLQRTSGAFLCDSHTTKSNPNQWPQVLEVWATQTRPQPEIQQSCLIWFCSEFL